MKRPAAAAGLVLMFTVLVSVAGAKPAQVEIDRIVSRAGGRIITLSDIRQVRLLKLVADVSSDESTRRELENRWLVLSELARAVPVAAPGDAEIAAHRDEWRRSLGPDADALVRRAGMTEADLEAWLRDDLRARAFLGRQFGMLGDNDRQRATADWIARLRQRAQLAA